MPAINRTIPRTHLNRIPKVPAYNLNSRHHLSTTPLRSRESIYSRSDFNSQGSGFTSTYEPGRPTEGPLAQASKHGAPRLTPSLLKEHLDKYVVGQDKAKKVTSVAIYNHYQRIREIRRQEEEERARREQVARWELRERERNSHPVENEFPGHVENVDLNSTIRQNPSYDQGPPELGTQSLQDLDNKPGTLIEKSNLLLLGPSGVGKSYILSTLARILEVPFATVDCSSLTQAGYIGTDIESSIERLLLASSHEIKKCESGIIFFDEVDKLAKPAIMTHGRDVSGEGVQQGLLKMIEGTTVTVNAKSDKNSKSESSRGSDRMERGGRDGGVGNQPGKSEQYTIDTSNILFVFAGAFVGLEKIITSRLQSGSSLGFGSQLKSPPKPGPKSKIPKSPLDLVTPPDLQTYGLIPELLGRIPITVALSQLSLQQLVSILTEPRNSLVKQFQALFATYNIQLRFSTGALHAIAERALPPSSPSSSSNSKLNVQGSGIGARGLRSIMETVLQEVMFWGPGSAIRFCLVDEKFVKEQGEWLARQHEHEHEHEHDGEHDGEKSKMPRCWSRGQGKLFEEACEKEEEEWRARARRERGEEGEVESFEQFRSVGSSGM